MGTEALPAQVSLVTSWAEARAWVPLVQRKEESVGQFTVEERQPWRNGQQSRCRSIS